MYVDVEYPNKKSLLMSSEASIVFELSWLSMFFSTVFNHLSLSWSGFSWFFPWFQTVFHGFLHNLCTWSGSAAPWGLGPTTDRWSGLGTPQAQRRGVLAAFLRPSHQPGPRGGLGIGSTGRLGWHWMFSNCWSSTDIRSKSWWTGSFLLSAPSQMQKVKVLYWKGVVCFF